MRIVKHDCFDCHRGTKPRSEKLKPEPGPLRCRAALQAVDDDAAYSAAHPEDNYRWRPYRPGEFGPEGDAEHFFPFVFINDFADGRRRRFGLSFIAAGADGGDG
jgi:hypothetical protein